MTTSPSAHSLIFNGINIDTPSITSSETIGLLILKELQLMRQDVVASMLRIEEQINNLHGKQPKEERMQSVGVQSDFAENLSAGIKVCEKIYTTETIEESKYIDETNGNFSENCNSAHVKNEEIASRSDEEFSSGDKSLHLEINSAAIPIDDAKPFLNSINASSVGDSFGNCKEHSNDKILNQNAALKCCDLVANDISTSTNVDLILQKHNDEKLKPDVKSYRCYVCCRTFAYKSNFSQHMQTHFGSDSEDLRCGICNEVFISDMSLKFHMESHSKLTLKFSKQTEKALGTSHSAADEGADSLTNRTCPHCLRICSSVGVLNRHIRFHTNEKRFQCPVCSQKFFRKDYLNRHMRQHSKIPNNDKRYDCVMCSAHFFSKRSLESHILNQHSSDLQVAD